MSSRFKEIIGTETSLKGIYSLLQKVAPTDSTILVSGESGTGKEVFVRTLHEHSKRRDKPFIPINCGAIPEGLLESTLFGHERGAFTNAHRSSIGRFELAHGGTIFLDEIGEMDLSLQVKILRVLQEKEIERVGGSGPQKVDVRVVAATNKNLEKAIEHGHFREDLYYRLNVISVEIPPLRERIVDIIPLCTFFLEKFCKENNRKTLALSSETQEYLKQYSWQGNIRELENRMQYLSILVENDLVQLADLPQKIRDTKITHSTTPETTLSHQTVVPTHIDKYTHTIQTLSPLFEEWPSLNVLHDKNMSLKEFLETIENKLLQEALLQTEGVKHQAAKILGMKRTTLIEKLKKRGSIF
ncbi:MAG: sigma-54 interaction domain-containing protein [Desulfovibrionaceae bacterium]